MDEVNLRTDARHRKAKKSFSIYSVINVIGEICITLSVLIALFIVWQVYYTTWQVDGVKREAVSNFHKDSPIFKEKIAKNLRYDDPPLVQNISHGEVFAALYVPAWKSDPMPVAEGVETSILDLGYAGHYTETAMPGEIGNFALAGHRLTYGNNFDKLPSLVNGDEVIVETKDAWIIYKVSQHKIVLPTDVSAIAPVPYKLYEMPTQRIMTMTTCSTASGGRWGNTHRWITNAVFDHWVEKSDGIPAELAGTL